MSSPGAEGRPSLARRALLYGLIYGLVPLLLLAVAEGGLRWSGFGTSMAWLLERHCDDTRLHSPNPAFYQQFTAIPLNEIMNWDELEFSIPAGKSPGTCRIFAFGESALFGYRSAVRILEVMLTERFPGMRFEVYNAACPGMSSHVLRAAAREAALHQPDIFLIYMGNNEAVGPYGPNSLLGRTGISWSADTIQRAIRMNDLRLVQFLKRAATMPLTPPTREQILASMPKQTDNLAVAGMYADNLNAMLDSAREAGAATVLCTLTANRAFAGQTPVKPNSLDAIERSPLNQAVLDAVAARAGEGVYLADTDRRLYERSPSGVPDYTYFSDNIHLNFDGAYQLACAMFETVERTLPRAGDAGTVPPLSREEAALLLGWNTAAEIALLRIQVDAGFDEYSKEILRKRLAALEAEFSGDVQEGMAAACGAALIWRPEDAGLHRMYFEALLFGNRPEEALKAAEAMAAKLPCGRLSLRSMGQALNATMQGQRAREAYERVLAVYPDDLPSQASLALGAPGK